MKIGFTMVPNEVFESNSWKKLTMSCMMALIDLYRRRHIGDPSGFINEYNQWIEIKNNECFFGLKYISKEWNVSKKTANRYLKILEKAGYINLKQNRLGTRVTFKFFDEYGEKITTITTPKSSSQSKRSVTPYNTNNTINTKNIAKYKVAPTGVLVAYCSKCGKKQFPTTEWKVKEGSTCCRHSFIAEWPHTQKT